MNLDPAVAQLLALDPSTTTVTSHGGVGMSSASTSKIETRLPDGRRMLYFMKTGKGEEAGTMFQGEHASLNAIASTVPTLCPRSHGHGRFQSDPGMHFLATDFMELSSSHSGSEHHGAMSLAEKLAKLHMTPAPIPEGYETSQFGFPATTCCGDTPQDNSYRSSWAEFYAENRLRFILNRSNCSNGSDKQLSTLVHRTCDELVPRLLGDQHLNNGKGVTPVVVHGDLWSGNAGKAYLPTMPEGSSEEVIFDSSACYAHNEFELGIMKMFGGFGSGFLKDYHRLCPKTPPVAEYEDRIELYELYHHLNHYALFGGGYKSSAVGIMKRLLSKYGSESAGSL
ncbi:Mediator of RNA polymerase II transcription subunit 19 [Sphaceloma murrayae]|uniref:protein-ribulosamine 3-kinase n=1 Tax=Sphaceloma murrayae TaxID=2082308 RepID=A0A2K1QX55_9PEZI|nr:Mediator of RNA polymerase II transcription subunit 19 [Sphaceloma murrayae]